MPATSSDKEGFSLKSDITIDMSITPWACIFHLILRFVAARNKSALIFLFNFWLSRLCSLSLICCSGIFILCMLLIFRLFCALFDIVVLHCAISIVLRKTARETCARQLLNRTCNDCRNNQTKIVHQINIPNVRIVGRLFSTALIAFCCSSPIEPCWSNFS